ncbi:hypothetical protein ACJMK2_018364 [Sinanodonta woodiana]|uniref:Uncharacterized protein n=1 Tax=Sinanodonta woodiana TaxID=1069815 RepID=A0ABD3UH42_SINWO
MLVCFFNSTLTSLTFALVKLNWTKAHVDEILLPVLKQLNKKQTQLSIRSFFQPENFIELERIKSKRLQKAVKTFLKPSQSADDLEEVDVKKREAKNILLKTGGKGKGKGKGKYSKAKSVKKVGEKNNSVVPKWKDEVDLSEESSSEDEERLEGGFILNEGDEDEENKCGVSITQTKGKAPVKRGIGPKSRSHRGGNSLAKEVNSVIPPKRRKGIISLNAKDFERAIGCSDSESSTDDWLCQVDIDGFSGKREEKGKKAISATQSKDRNLKAKEATVRKAKEAKHITKRASRSSNMSAQNTANKIYLSESSSDSDS